MNSENESEIDIKMMAYDLYISFTSYDRNTYMPKFFDDLPIEIQNRWKNVAKFVISQIDEV